INCLINISSIWVSLNSLSEWLIFFNNLFFSELGLILKISMKLSTKSPIAIKNLSKIISPNWLV
ncbi:MAG: hypothetical protein K8V75_07230, partial [Methanobrevibacter woesei]|nr:hypothetical protein [Methanobrevibacter woesei]